MRQQARRAAFQYAFSQMPYVETWETTHTLDTGFRDAEGNRMLTDITRNHAKTIPRRKRRDMARKLAKRK